MRARTFLKKVARPSSNASRAGNKKGEDKAGLDTGWNIFRGGAPGNDIVVEVTGIGRPFYMCASVHLSQHTEEQGTGPQIPTEVLIWVDAATKDVPGLLASRLGHLAACNDHAWVEGVEEVGTLDDIPVWKLICGS